MTESASGSGFGKLVRIPQIAKRLHDLAFWPSTGGPPDGIKVSGGEGPRSRNLTPGDQHGAGQYRIALVALAKADREMANACQHAGIGYRPTHETGLILSAIPDTPLSDIPGLTGIGASVALEARPSICPPPEWAHVVCSRMLAAVSKLEDRVDHVVAPGELADAVNDVTVQIDAALDALVAGLGKQRDLSPPKQCVTRNCPDIAKRTGRCWACYQHRRRHGTERKVL